MWVHHSLTLSLHSCLSAWSFSPPPFAGSAAVRATIGQAPAPAACRPPLLPSIAIHPPPAFALKGVSSTSGPVIRAAARRSATLLPPAASSGASRSLPPARPARPRAFKL